MNKIEINLDGNEGSVILNGQKLNMVEEVNITFGAGTLPRVTLKLLAEIVKADLDTTTNKEDA